MVLYLLKSSYNIYSSLNLAQLEYNRTWDAYAKGLIHSVQVLTAGEDLRAYKACDAFWKALFYYFEYGYYSGHFFQTFSFTRAYTTIIVPRYCCACYSGIPKDLDTSRIKRFGHEYIMTIRDGPVDCHPSLFQASGLCTNCYNELFRLTMTQNLFLRTCREHLLDIFPNPLAAIILDYT